MEQLNKLETQAVDGRIQCVDIRLVRRRVKIATDLSEVTLRVNVA